jgi:hypothetical protein
LGEARRERTDGRLAPFGLVLVSVFVITIDVALRSSTFRLLSSTKPLDSAWSFAMACVALNIPSAIRLIRLFNILFSLARVETRCVERLKRRFCTLVFTPKQKDPPPMIHGGPAPFFDSWRLATGVGPNRSRALNSVSISRIV